MGSTTLSEGWSDSSTFERIFAPHASCLGRERAVKRWPRERNCQSNPTLGDLYPGTDYLKLFIAA